jgi:hypothetical protein
MAHSCPTCATRRACHQALDERLQQRLREQPIAGGAAGAQHGEGPVHEAPLSDGSEGEDDAGGQHQGVDDRTGPCTAGEPWAPAAPGCGRFITAWLSAAVVQEAPGGPLQHPQQRRRQRGHSPARAQPRLPDAEWATQPPGAVRAKRSSGVSEQLALTAWPPFEPADALHPGVLHRHNADLDFRDREYEIGRCSGGSSGAAPSGPDAAEKQPQQQAPRLRGGGGGGGPAPAVRGSLAGVPLPLQALLLAGRATGPTAKCRVGSSSRGAEPVSDALVSRGGGLWTESEAEADAEADAHLAQLRRAALLPGAALALQSAWRARGPRLKLSR